jgi:indolepyruvate ferredoxin oxidoreductase alpha subunit
MAAIPLLEPATLQEAKDMTVAGFAISEELGLPVMLRTTTRLNHTRGPITLGELAPRPGKGHFVKDPFHQVMVPAVARGAHARLLEKQPKAQGMAEKSPFNTITGSGNIGVVVSGVAASYVADALLELGLTDKVTVLKLGFTHPLPAGLITGFLRKVEKVLVVEELEPYLEDGIKAIAQAQGLTLPIRGKGDGLFSRLYEFHPALVRQVMADFFGVPQQVEPPVAPQELFGQPLPDRPPNLCPGCPHRAMYYAVKIALRDLHLEGIFPTDIGCYTLGLLPPLSMADYLICMGSSITTACGISRATGQKVVAFIGDSTFFHGGLTGLANAVHNRHDVLLVILDNGTTAMTGQQPHPGVTMTPPGYPGQPIEIEGVVRALGVEQLWRVNPFKYKESLAAAKEAVQAQGVRVLLSQAPCHLYMQRLQGKKRTARFQIKGACAECHHCLEYFGCPAMYLTEDGSGQMAIDTDICSGCAFCVQFCDAIRPVKAG